MRYIPPELRERLQKAVQADSTNARPEAILWISRADTALRGSEFLEEQKIQTVPTLKTPSIAVCHPYLGRNATRVYIARISGGRVGVLYANTTPLMNAHTWVQTDFSEPGEATCIAFDGTMPKTTKGKIELVTERIPWVFWADKGRLYGQRLNEPEQRTVLAEQNVTAISAVRGMWSESGGIDVGLVLFFIANGGIFYRQLIRGSWTDGVPVNLIPGQTFQAIAAARTWDFRIVLQAQAIDGTLYELFTQFEGVGKQNTEHLEVSKIAAIGERTEVFYTDTKAQERLEIGELLASGQRLYALSPVMIGAKNLDDGTGDFGKWLQITFDYPVYRLSGNARSFSILDSLGSEFYGSTILSEEGETTVTIGFDDFNRAAGECFARYAGETVTGPVAALEAGSFPFTPENLVPPLIDPPTVQEVWNE